MTQEVPEGRISVDQLTAKTAVKTVVEPVRKDRRIVEQESETPSDLDLARAGRDQKFTTFVSKIRELRVYVKPDEKIITADMKTHVKPAVVIEFKNWVFVCENQEQEDFMLGSKELGRRFWTKAEYVKMINAEKNKALAVESAHQKLLAMELAGKVEDPRDHDLVAGMRSEPDSPRNTPAGSHNDGD